MRPLRPHLLRTHPRAAVAYAVRALSVAALALACPRDAEQEREGAAPTATQVPARTRVADFDALRVTSSIVFEGAPDRPHSLDATFAFPARARLALRAPGTDRGARVLRYRSGAELFGYAAHAETSHALTGTERDDELLGLEARLALFLFPEAHTWQGTGETRHAELPGLGALEAHIARVALTESVDPAAKTDGATKGAAAHADVPVRVRALRADGSEVETLTAESWTAYATRSGPRPFPRALALSSNGARIWREEIQALDTRSQWSDAFFVPPDRRARLGTDVAEVHAVDLGERWVREVPLPSDVDSLAAAVAHAQRVQASERARGVALVAATTLVVDASLTPRAVRLELAAAPVDPPPSEWRALAPEPAWVVLVDAVAQLTPRHVAALAAATGSETNTWLVEVHATAPGSVRLLGVRARE